MLGNANDSVFAHALDECSYFECVCGVVAPGAAAFFHERILAAAVFRRVKNGSQVHVYFEFFQCASDFVGERVDVCRIHASHFQCAGNASPCIGVRGQSVDDSAFLVRGDDERDS